MKELMDQLDNWVNFTDPVNKQMRRVGLTIHFSPSSERWEVSYGRQRSSSKHTGYGKTVEEALQDKLNKIE
jgi:hypothetical protein